MKTLFIQLSRQLQTLSAALNVHCCWKNGPMLFPEKRLPEDTTKHRCRFCDSVKQHACWENRCRRNDGLILTERLTQSKGKSFTSQCPAGAWDLVIPFRSGEEYLGAVLAGPFRMPDSLPALESELYDDLPIFTEKRCQDIARLITEFMTPVINRIYHNGLPADSRFAAACDYLQKHFAEKTTAEKVAQKIGLSRSRFLHSFADQCGMSFYHKLNLIRLEQARGRMWHSDESLDQIAAECGFSSQSHFSAAFKEAYGTTPRRWRKSMEK